MPDFDCHSTIPINRFAYTESELITLISQQRLVGNYTNQALLRQLFRLPKFKLTNPFPLEPDLQASIDDMKKKCKQQSEEGCTHALTLLGELYFGGIAYPQDYAKAIYCFDEAMKRDDKNSYAINNCAAMYLMGLREIKDTSEVEKLFIRATQLNNPVAMSNLAHLYTQQGGKANLELAIYWYKKACKLGDSDSMLKLARWYEEQGEKANLDLAIHWYSEACQLGNSNAMIELAHLYTQQGGKANLDLAIEWYTKACQLDDSDAMCGLAYLYEQQGGKANLDLAIEWYTKACESGNSNAMIELAHLYTQQGGKDNLDLAIEWYTKACQLDDSDAMCGLAYLYEQQGGKANLDLAIEWYTKACQSGNSKVMNNLAHLYTQQGGKDNLDLAIRWFSKACQLGDSNAMYNLGILYYRGYEGGEKNLALAIHFFEMAIRNNHSHAQAVIKTVNIKQALFNIINIKSGLGPKLIAIIWDELVLGKSFTKDTLEALAQVYRKDIINRLKESHEWTSLYFLQNLKTNLNHPLAFILNKGNTAVLNNKFKSFLDNQSAAILRTRMFLFGGSIRKNKIPSEECSLDRLPEEIKAHLFPFVHPGLKKDKQLYTLSLQAKEFHEKHKSSQYRIFDSKPKPNAPLPSLDSLENSVKF